MMDKEIIKALECCIKKKCTNCPHTKMFCSDTVAMEHALDLIKRQQKEIEMLKKTEIEIDDFCRRLCRMRMLNGNAIASYEDLQNYIQQEKSEAIKEFAERLKNKIKIECNPYGRPTFDYETSIAIMRYINNLVEGIVED